MFRLVCVKKARRYWFVSVFRLEKPQKRTDRPISTLQVAGIVPVRSGRSRPATTCDSRPNYGFSNDLPHTPVGTGCFERDQPAVRDESSGRVDRALSIPDGVRAETRNLPHADGIFFPSLEEIEQPLRALELVAWRLDLLFGRSWSSAVEPFK